MHFAGRVLIRIRMTATAEMDHPEHGAWIELWGGLVGIAGRWEGRSLSETVAARWVSASRHLERLSNRRGGQPVLFQERGVSSFGMVSGLFRNESVVLLDPESLQEAAQYDVDAFSY